MTGQIALKLIVYKLHVYVHVRHKFKLHEIPGLEKNPGWLIMQVAVGQVNIKTSD